MKKILLFTVAAATAMAFTGCSQSSELADTESNNTETTQKAISFDTYLSKTTRAGAAGAQDTETLKTNGFGVFAYYTGQDTYANTTAPNFMYNTKVSGTAFTYSPVRYWPNNDNDKLSFFAYAPYVEVTAGTGLPADVKSGITALSNNAYTGAPTVTYKLADDKTQSVDLLWGAKMGTTTNEVNTDLTRTKDNVKSVGFTFKHALAKFGGDNSCIKAVLATDDNNFDNNATKVTISEIKITSNNITTQGTLNLTTGTWSSQDGKGTMTLDIPISAISEDIAGTADKEIDGTAAGELKGLQTTTTNVLKGDAASYYFIPGTQPKFDVTVTYWVRTIDSSLSAGVTNVKQTIKKTIQFPNAFEANKKYNLILSIGLNTVKFSAEVSDWASDTEAVTTTVNVPEVLK